MNVILNVVFVLLLTSLSSVSYGGDDSAEFWQALQEGGKVVLVRHAEIDREFGDSFLLDETCFGEKNLSDQGKLQAQAINNLFKQYNIVIDQVLSSPHCRTKDTAKLAFGAFEVAPHLRLIKALPEAQAQKNLQQTRLLISQFKGSKDKGNLVLVTHRPNIGELIHYRLEPAEIALLEPLATQKGEVVFDFISKIAIVP